MPARDTSIQAYWSERLGLRLAKQASQVLDNLYIHGTASRADLAKRLDMKINCVCGRVHELMQAGHIENNVRITDPNTGMQVWLLKYKEVQDVQVS